MSGLFRRSDGYMYVSHLRCNDYATHVMGYLKLNKMHFLFDSNGGTTPSLDGAVKVSPSPGRLTQKGLKATAKSRTRLTQWA